jgi:hypothetical protein
VGKTPLKQNRRPSKVKENLMLHCALKLKVASDLASYYCYRYNCKPSKDKGKPDPILYLEAEGGL